jgi:hypothetical protein
MTELAFISAVDRVNAAAIRFAIGFSVFCAVVWFLICKLGWL